MTGIAEFMGRDHDRLDAILAELRREPDSETAKDLFSRFDAGLRAHIVWEEEILFPPFEERTGMRDAGPTAVMRMEHQEIKQLLETIGEAIGRHDPAEPVGTLVEVLTAHNQKEENVLYPWLDRSLPEEERSALLDRIEQSRAPA